MKYYTSTLCCLFLLFFTVEAFAQKATFTISGTVNPTLNISKLFFTKSNFYGNGDAKPEEIAVADGKFIIKGSLDSPLPAFLSLSKDYKSNPGESKQFILDEGSIRVSIEKSLPEAVIAGSKAHDDVMRYTTEQAPIASKLNAINEEASKLVQSGVNADTVSLKYRIPFKVARNELLTFQKRFIVNNPNAFISLLLIPDLARVSHDFFQADSLFMLLDSKIRSAPTAKLLREYIDKEMKVSIGASAPAFTMADTSGKEFSLSSLKGKYVLLDFWAAWCAPCRDENPNVVMAHENFKGRGFTVLGVSLDRTKGDWLKAIQKDNLKWQHVSDLKQWQSSAAALYGITSIPRNFLLDPTGKIIARDLRGPDLIDKLNEIFP